MDDAVSRQAHALAVSPEDGGDVLRRPRFADSYGLVLLLLVVYAFAAALVDDNQYGRLIVLVILAATTWMALRASLVERRVPRLPLVLIVLIPITGIVFGVAAGEELTRIALVLLNVVLILVAPVAIARRLVSHPTVNLETFFGAVCVYLMIAMFFASMYTLIALATDEPFFAQDPTVVTSTDYLYFSLTTITTTGYGDLSAQGQAGRLLAMTEAVLGQLYLITVVAVVVQNLGQSRKNSMRRERRRD